MYLVVAFLFFGKSQAVTPFKDFDNNTNKKTHKKHTNKSVIITFFFFSSLVVSELLLLFFRHMVDFFFSFLFRLFVVSAEKNLEEEKIKTCC